MKTSNIGWLYYKEYHQINDDQVVFFKNAPVQKDSRREDYFKKHYEGKNNVILGIPFDENTSKSLQVVPPNEILRFVTTYPGLTIGTGYSHGINESGEFKLGFFFDHATGFPCIPGSTIKGCLRSMFPQKQHKKVSNKNEKYDYLASVIRELPGISSETIDDYKLGREFDQKELPERKNFIDFIERELFDGEKPERSKDSNYIIKDNEFVYKAISIYERDIFFDAYLVSTQHPALNRSTYQNQKPFIGEDFITPHINRKNHKLSQFTNPIPLMFLKILPKVTIQFQFNLNDGQLTKEQKTELIRHLLLDTGIGAKTNVGYGQFHESSHNQNNNRHTKTIPVSSNQNQPHSNLQNQTHTAKEPHKSNTPKTILNDFPRKPKNGDDIEVKVIDYEKRIGEVSIESKILKVTIVKNCPQQGYIYRATVTQVLPQGISVKIDNHKPLLE